MNGAGVVDQDVQSTLFASHLFEQCLYLVVDRVIDAHLRRGGRLEPRVRDALDGVVEDRVSWLVYTRVKTYRLGDFRDVSLQRNIRTSRTSSDGTSTSGSHQSLSVDLRFADAAKKHVRLAFDYEPAVIRPLAQHVARYTGLPLHDDLADAHYE